MNKKRYIEKFIENKKVPNATFSLVAADGQVLEIDLADTVQRIYEANQGLEVKKLLKKGQFRNASIEKCLKLFEGAAQRFLMDDYDLETSKIIQDILGKAHRRKDSLFIEMQEKDTEKGKHMYEIIFIDKDDKEKPYLMKKVDTKEIRPFDKKSFIEFWLKQHTNILQII